MMGSRAICIYISFVIFLLNSETTQGEEKDVLKNGLKNSNATRSQSRNYKNEGKEDENTLVVEARKFLKQCGSKRNDSEISGHNEMNMGQEKNEFYDSNINNWNRNGRNPNTNENQNRNTQYDQNFQVNPNYNQNNPFNQAQSQRNRNPPDPSNQNSNYPGASYHNKRNASPGNNYGNDNPYSPGYSQRNPYSSNNGQGYNNANNGNHGFPSSNDQKTSQCDTSSNGNYGNSDSGNNNRDWDRNSHDPYRFSNVFRSKRFNYSNHDDQKDYEGDEECVSQCVFGYLQLLDDDRTPSESMVIKWLQDHSTGSDMDRIKSLREARLCFARLAATDTEDGCEFSKELATCLDLDLD